MKKESLIELKKLIENLTEEEKAEREKYLKGLATGVIQGPPVGYPSIDRPWIKYYREKPIKEINPNQTIYDMVFDQEDMDKDAVGYLGVNWTFKKLKEDTDRLAKVFAHMGVKEGDVVLVGVSNSPESLLTLLALNELGAISKWFDLRASEKDIASYANTSRCKHMVAFDTILPKIEKAIDNTELEKVLVMSPADPLSYAKKALYNLKTIADGTHVKLPKDKRFIKFKDALKQANQCPEIKKAEFDKDRASIMIQSSGTTGKPKTITHSDFSATSFTREIAYSDLPLGKDKKILVALPPWIAYGIGDAIILPLALGTKVELCPNFDPDSVFKNVGKFTMAFAAPFHYRYLKDNFDKLSKKQKESFKDVECLVSGGDKISVEENREFEKVFNTVLVNGYGNNESWGALTVNPTKNNKYGTVGIPKYSETMISYDEENEIELPYGEIGEICAISNTNFLRYEGNEKATKEVNKFHKDDNKIWAHTGDLGYIDKDGYVNLAGRARRVIVRLGFKISAYTIEDEITNNPLVKECVAISVPDEKEEHVPMAYVVLKDGINEQKEIAESLIKEKCFDNLKEYEVPKYIKVVDELPYTNGGKYDFVYLEKEGKKFVESLKSQRVKILKNK